jgi:multiple sugar transport system ATP-binding protein
MDGIRLEQVTKVYRNGVRAVESLDLHIRDGEFMVLVGPSGCGKSTILRMIAGLEQVTGGSIQIDGLDVTDVDPQARDIAMVFQNYALYPQMTVRQNLAFGLRFRGTPVERLRRASKEDRVARVNSVARTLGLESLLDRKPGALSGGQRQRVAMGRAIVREPKAFLMDEPLSNLDAKLRVSLRAELARLHQRLGVTTVYVTHDQVEAMTLGQRVAVMCDGTLQQCDTPQNLFHRPANLFVAAFMGSPAMNLVQGELQGETVVVGEWAIPLPPGSSLTRRTGPVVVGMRPTDFEHADTAAPDLPRYTVQPMVVEELGAESYVIFPLDVPRLETSVLRAAADAESEGEGTLLADDNRAQLTARVSGRRPVTTATKLEIALDHRSLHFFDPASGIALADRPLVP